MTKEDLVDKLVEAKVNEYENKDERIIFYHSHGKYIDEKEEAIKFAFRYLFHKDIQLTREYHYASDSSMRSVIFMATVPHYFYVDLIRSPYFQEVLSDEDGHLLWCRFEVSF